jgi:hypothetical protein
LAVTSRPKSPGTALVESRNVQPANVGTSSIVTETASDGSDVPTAFIAVTVIEYVAPFVRPVITHEVVVDVHDSPPGKAVAV